MLGPRQIISCFLMRIVREVKTKVTSHPDHTPCIVSLDVVLFFAPFPRFRIHRWRRLKNGLLFVNLSAARDFQLLGPFQWEMSKTSLLLGRRLDLFYLIIPFVSFAKSRLYVFGSLNQHCWTRPRVHKSVALSSYFCFRFYCPNLECVIAASI